MPKKEIVKEENTDIFELLEHYKCSICKEEFYLLKDEKYKDEEIFKSEDYAHLPIFLKENPNKITCSYCKASRKSLIYIETEKEKKNKLEEMKEKLKALKEEEKRLDALRSKEIDSLCSEIEKDVLAAVKELQSDIKSGKYSVDTLVSSFRKEAYRLLDLDSKMYNKRNKEVDIVLSNRYLAGFDTVISDFGESIRDAFYTLEKSNEKADHEKEQNLSREDISENEKEKVKDKAEDEKDKNKDKFKDAVKDSSDEIKGDFKGYLKNKVK